MADQETAAPDEPTLSKTAPFSHPTLAVFVLLTKFLGAPTDPEQIAPDRGKGDAPYSLEHLNRIARKLG